jgi:arylsulfatase A-like enzyme/TolA-binding protein
VWRIDRRHRDRVGPRSCLVAVLFGLIAGCSETPHDETRPPVEAPGEVHTVVLVSIDTLRRDAVGFFSDRRPSPTPFLDQLAAQGNEGSRLNGFPATVEGTRTLAQHLSDAGWTTGAFVSCFVLDRRFGFDRGFDTYDADLEAVGPGQDLEATERPGRETVRTALEWIADRRPTEKVFLWVHLFEPHQPYPPAQAPFDGPHGDYLTDVREADRQVAALYGGLTEAGRSRDRSLWVVVSDHGEGLGEHGELTHGLLLHGATTRIPLLFAGGGIEAGRDDQLASTPDLLPTILGRLGLSVPVGDGVDLMARERLDERSIPLETMLPAMAWGLGPVQGLRTERWLWESSPKDHLWDVIVDPKEELDIADRRAEKVVGLAEIRAAFGFPPVPQDRSPDAETMAMLSALGYVGSVSETGTKDVRELVTEGARWIHEISDLRFARRFEEAEVLAQRFLQRYPRSTTMWFDAAFISLGRGRLDEAEVRLRRVLELQPGYDDARLNLGNLLATQGRADEAEAIYREVLKRDSESLHALFNLGTLMDKQQKSGEAAIYYRKVIELHPDHPRAAVARQRLASLPAGG